MAIQKSPYGLPGLQATPGSPGSPWYAGVQRQVPIEGEIDEEDGDEIDEDGDELQIVGAAGLDAVWLATGDGESVIEVGLNGEVRRTVLLRPEFWVRWAQGDELLLDSVDGSWSYDASTREATPLAGDLVSDGSPLLIDVSCDSGLECRVEVDRGDGLTPVDGLRVSDVTDNLVFVAPDLTGIVFHDYGSDEFTYFDLLSGTRVDLREIDIDLDRSVVWLPESPWMIGVTRRRPELGSPVFDGLIAVNVQTTEQVQLDIPVPRLVIGPILVAVPPA